ncbi:MAG: response regulator transcription factor [Chloroflexota bacterium]|nr:MAG: response regulator transcription factor [Chloroflexota bacterium]
MSVGAAERRILIVDDEPNLVDAVRIWLEMEGFLVVSAITGREALEKVRDLLPDLIILDVMMPGMDGFETLRELRKISSVPVIMLTARAEEDDRVRGLKLGADDYVAKPFSQRELASRVQAVLRRAEAPPLIAKTDVRVDDDLTIDFSRAEVHLRGERVQLTPTEYRLLYHLASNPGRVLPNESILAKVWGMEYREEEHYVRLYVNYLRQKIEPDPSHPKYVLTERGLGYRFVDFRQPGRAAGRR